MAKLIFILIQLITFASASNTERLIDINQAVALTLKYNVDIQNAKLGRVSQKYALKASQYEFDWQNNLTAQSTLVDADKDTTIHNSTSVTPITSIKNKFGTEFKFTPHYSFDTGIEPTVVISQPLIRGFGTQVVLSDLRNAEQQNEIDKLNYRNTISQAISGTLTRYVEVLSSEYRTRALQRSIHINRLNLEQTKIKYQFGRATKTDVNSQRMELANSLSDIASSRAKYQESLNQLKNSINISDDHIIIKDDIELLRTKLHIPTREKAYRALLKNNITYQTLKLQLQQNEQSYIRAKDDMRIELNVIGTAKPLDFANDSNLAIELDVPINNVNKKQAIVDAKTSIQQTKQSIAAQLTILKNRANNLVKELELLHEAIQQQHEELTLQNQRLHLDQARLDRGYISVFEVNQKIRDRDDELDELQNLEIDFSTKLINLYNEMGLILDYWHVVLPKNY